MKIVFLDASTVGGFLLDAFTEFGTFISYATTSRDEVMERVIAADIVITNKVEISREVMEQCASLKLICIAATGMNCVDLVAAEEIGVEVKNVAGYSTASVCQHCIGMMINVVSNMHHYNRGIRSWSGSPIFTQLHYPISDLSGKVLGIIGMGAIGRAVSNVAQALGMEVCSLARSSEQLSQTGRLGRDDFFKKVDVVSLHCPLTDGTREIINAKSLALMKPSAVVINTGRGALVNEADLAHALDCGIIAGAGLDVLTEEPPAANNRLVNLEHPGLFITPHTAWASRESIDRLMQGVFENIQSFRASNG